MKKNINSMCAKIIGCVCKKMALSQSASACFIATYQPREPECLKKNK